MTNKLAKIIDENILLELYFDQIIISLQHFLNILIKRFYMPSLFPNVIYSV